jgi:hypothetical protein
MSKRKDLELKFNIFISHDPDDETIAQALKDFLAEVFLNSEVFVPGRDLTGGQVWIKEMREKLKNSAVIVAVITPYSINSHWVLFEAGSGFIDGKTIPLCADAIMLQDLQPPLSFLHDRIFSADGLKQLVNDIAQTADVCPPTDHPGLEEAIKIVNDFVFLRGQFRQDLKLEQVSSEKIGNDSTPIIRDPDTRLASQTDKLEEIIRNVMIKTVENAASNHAVPESKDLNSMILSELIEIARSFNIPFPDQEIRSLQFLKMTLLEKAAPSWKKLNAENKIKHTFSEIKKFEKSLDF